MISHMSFKKFALLFALLSTTLFVNGQGSFIKKMLSVPYDSSYISTYISDYTARVYGSIKYSNMGYNDNMIGQSLAYRPNNKLLFGIGANHGFLGINLGFNIPYVNQDDDKYGKTDYIDFTLRIFTPRFNTTIYLQNYKGFYLRNTKDIIPGWQPGDPYYIRPDIRSRTTGLDICYIFNSTRFSYRAAILQNEWQKKSAGSLLVGGNLFYNANIGDSSIVPSKIHYTSFYEGLKFIRSNNLSFGPMVGYAHTFVIKSHIFLMGSINGSGIIGFTQLNLVDNVHKVKSKLIFGVRSELILSAGYNSDRWYFGFSFINLSLVTQAPIPERTISYDTGMYRLNIVRRFATKKPIRFLNSGIRR
jgi:hypothetical protein